MNLQHSYNNFAGFANNLFTQTGKTSLDYAKEIVRKHAAYLQKVCEAHKVTPAQDPCKLSAQVLCIIADKCNSSQSFAGLTNVEKVEKILPAAVINSELAPALITAATPEITAVSWQDATGSPYVIPKTMQPTTQGPAPKTIENPVIQTATDIIQTLQGLTQGSGTIAENVAGNAGTFVLSETIKKNLPTIIIAVIVLLALVYLTAKAAK